MWATHRWQQLWMMVIKVDVNTSAAPFKLERHSEGHGGI